MEWTGQDAVLAGQLKAHEVRVHYLEGRMSLVGTVIFEDGSTVTTSAADAPALRVALAQAVKHMWDTLDAAPVAAAQE